MTSHTPQPPAGDDFDRVADAELVERMAPEPVAGEVEVVAWRWHSKVREAWFLSSEDPEFSPIDLEYGHVFDLQSLVTKSSYDALAAAKDAEIAALEQNINSMCEIHDLCKGRAEAVERQRDALRAALAPFSAVADAPGMHLFTDEYKPIGEDIVPTAGDYRRAKAALKDEGSAP